MSGGKTKVAHQNPKWLKGQTLLIRPSLWCLAAASDHPVAAVRRRLVALLRLKKTLDFHAGFPHCCCVKNNTVNMAPGLGLLARWSVFRNNSQLTFVSRPGRMVTPARTAVCSSSGAILPKPKKVSAAPRKRCHQVQERWWVPAALLLSLNVYPPWRCLRSSNGAVSVVVVWPPGKQTPFGLIRIALVVVPFLYVGTQISKNFAALLEEHDIFVPEDDDDDDWRRGGVCGASCSAGITCMWTSSARFGCMNVGAKLESAVTILKFQTDNRALKCFLSFAGCFFPTICDITLWTSAHTNTFLGFSCVVSS